ncbi:MAG TPA: RuBisCO large subunit C-terminal-like domain-containing protein, partial [Anaerolineaceae bacterium]|nr:RuBisCO large subunit C-terminal-like domain-containing protein [Anaerolineaceae bacterium]
IHPATAVQVIRDLGPDIMMTVGGAIQGHPSGAAAGVKAMQAAITAACAKIPLAEMSEQVPELKKALEIWK